MKQDVTEDQLIRYVLGEASESEIKEVTAWINASEANARQYEQTRFILKASEQLAQVSPLTETEAWDKFKEKRTAAQDAIPVRSIGRPNNWLHIAATAFLIIGASWAGYYFFNQRSKAPEFVTIRANDKVLTDTLPDGSVVYLNKRSNIIYASNFKQHREIKLVGEAFFDVVHNSSAPFTVHAGNVTARDIGTSFNVNSTAKRIEVIVEKGIVEVSSKSQSLRLEKQEMVTIEPGVGQLHKEQVKDLLYNYYRSDKFIASNTPLYRLVAMLNEAYNANIRIENKAVANAPITGTFPNSNTVDAILNAIILSTPEIHMEKTKDGIVLK
ncbi:MAG TPA: FecR domain-containing protein [Mucilaginibacter sp.]